MLRGLTGGIDSYLAGDWRYWRITSAVIGCVPWLNDDEVVAQLLRFNSSCIVINKLDTFAPNRRTVPTGPMRRLLKDGPGFPLDSLRRFDDLAPQVDGRPALIGPYDHVGDKSFPSLRVAGVSKRRGVRTIPLVHAKVLVLGAIYYSDEGAMGEVGDFFVFQPRRVWLGSANLTFNSRRSLEFGIWSDDPSLVATTSEFVVDLMAYSEPVESAQLRPQPELVPYEFDDEAMAEAMRDMQWEEPDDDDY